MIYDVIIVGSGISGLNTAHQLKKKSPNLKILMLEKEPRIGGRIQSINLHQNMNYEDHISRSTSDYIKNLRELSMECVRNIELTLKILCELIIFIVIILFLGLINYKILLLFFLTFLPIFLVYEIFLKPINIRLGETQTNALRNTYNIIDNKEEYFTKKKSTNVCSYTYR